MPDRPKSTVQQAREERLSRALRENLKRRKAQLRGRNQAEKQDKPKNPADPQRDG
jgi:hypothetical protein